MKNFEATYTIALATGTDGILHACDPITKTVMIRAKDINEADEKAHNIIAERHGEVNSFLSYIDIKAI